MHKEDVIVNWELMNCCDISSLEQSAASKHSSVANAVKYCHAEL